MKTSILVILLLYTFKAMANSDTIFIGFGEIPFLADSFKPSLGYFRKFDQSEVGIYLQLKDNLRRDDESFNADFGQDGLLSSKEETGYRAMLQNRYFPYGNVFNLGLGLIFGGQDTEQTEFDSRIRSIGSHTYESSISVNLKREQKLVPAWGFGFSYPISKQWYFSSDFTMAWLGAVPEPEITINTSANVLNSDLNSLKQSIKGNYTSNFHNRYHLFNLGMEYRF